jgi:hypothetical protein
MDAYTEMTPIALPPGETMVLDNATGIEVICRAGSLWITQYGDSRDIVLGPGQSFALGRPAGVVMTASKGADFVLRSQPQRPAPAARGGWLRRVAEFFDPSWSGRAQQALDGRIRVHRVA